MPLDLPQPDTSRLNDSPLELVVCQIRFENTPAAQEASTALAFHEALGGGAGPYPKLEQFTNQAVNVTVGPGANPATQTTTLTGWRFGAADGSWVISLMPDYVSIETSRYTTWEEDFRPRLAEVIDLTVSHINPAVEQRLGLRYIDRITELGLQTARDWEPYIIQELLGLVLHPQLGDSVRVATQQLVLAIDDQLGCGLRHGFIGDAADGGQLDYLLDFDLYRQGGRQFAPDGLKQIADELNVRALQLFQAVVTPALLDRLRGS